MKKIKKRTSELIGIEFVVTCPKGGEYSFPVNPVGLLAAAHYQNVAIVCDCGKTGVTIELREGCEVVVEAGKGHKIEQIEQ